MSVRTGFDVGLLLQSDPDTMVEMGHGPRPVALWQRPRRYIGVEAGLRGMDGLVEVECQRTIARRIGLITEFVAIDVGNGNDYNPHTGLPDGIANLVVASNVAGDDMVRNAPDGLPSLFQEISRLLSDDGVGVIRETYTPEISDMMGPVLSAAGLRVLGLVNCGDLSTWSTWNKLESRYAGRDDPENDYREPNPGSYYLFVGKVATG